MIIHVFLTCLCKRGLRERPYLWFMKHLWGPAVNDECQLDIVNDDSAQLIVRAALFQSTLRASPFTYISTFPLFYKHFQHLHIYPPCLLLLPLQLFSLNDEWQICVLRDEWKMKNDETMFTSVLIKWAFSWSNYFYNLVISFYLTCFY